MNNYIVGVYHRDESCRKAALQILDSEFDCVEIETWDELENTQADTIVIMSPELLYPEKSFETMVECIRGLRANVIMVNHSNYKWWIFRLHFTRLIRPSNELLMACIKAYSPPGWVKRKRTAWNVKLKNRT